MPTYKTKAVNEKDMPITKNDFICAVCVNSGIYTEDGFMGHLAVTCKLMSYKYGEYQTIVEPDSPNEDGTLDFINECDSFLENENATYKHLIWFNTERWTKDAS